ncbi:MAG: gliding motility-associated C-terminal domain-containing protein [Flavobacteriales bacterium]|nr:gliding motility-associated C-terminal domain-containing protein [Flavobacteriales bacterium]
MKKILLGSLFLVTSFTWMNAQEFCFGGQSLINDCGAFLTDPGCSSSDYSANFSDVVTVCDDGTGDGIVNLYFASFDLGTGDQMEIYDGPDTGSPLIGTYVLNDLQTTDITSTGTCITVVFTTDGDNSVGNFGAEISCELPCAKPFAIVNTDETELDPIKVCVGEEIVFDGSASTFQNGAALQSFIWDFGDAITNTTDWPSVTHSFAYPGAFKVQLHLTDNNDCSSANLPDVLVFVSTTPDLTLTASDYEVCVGQEVLITGLAEPTTWDAIPDVDFGGGLYIPDDQTQCFSDEITFSAFAPGETIDDIGDIESLFINFEHSFMGDIVVTYICPNGNSIATHQQNGGGCYLGEPDESDEQIPGIGYDYWWSPDATNGTWAENACNDGNTTSSGTYESVQPFTNLIGCPLNGTWTIEVCDLWGVDNGFIFDWSVQFDESLYPELISFTPSIGLDCDSTFWEGSFLGTSTLCDQYNTIFPEIGSFTYVYNALDDFGCLYQDSIVIEAYEGPIPDAGLTAPYCGIDLPLNGVVTNPNPDLTYVYEWSPAGALNNVNIADPLITDLDEETWFYVTINPAQDPQCAVSDSVFIFLPEPPVGAPVDSLEFCAGGDTKIYAPEQIVDVSYDWQLFPSADPDNPEFAGSGVWVEADEDGIYVVTITENQCGYTAFASYLIDLVNCNIVIPNIFTPNQDGENDNLEFEGLEYFPKSSLKVYDRWGILMYESDNYQNNWNPTEIAEGTYYFILGLRKQGSFEYHEGYVMVLTDEK